MQLAADAIDAAQFMYIFTALLKENHNVTIVH